MPHANRGNELRGRALARREPPDAPRHQSTGRRLTTQRIDQRPLLRSFPVRQDLAFCRCFMTVAKRSEAHVDWIHRAANNYASSLASLQRRKEAKALLRERVPVARRILGEGHRLTLKMRLNYAQSLYMDVYGATLDDLHESVTTLEDLERRSQRVLGIAHPFTKGVAIDLFQARTELSLHRDETPPSPSG